MKELSEKEQYNISGGWTISLLKNNKFVIPEIRIHLYDENGKHVGDNVIGKTAVICIK